MHTNKICIFSFFSGAGFMDLGFEDAGFEVVYINEVHQPFLDAYNFSRGKMKRRPPKYAHFKGDIQDCLNGPESTTLRNHTQKERDEGHIVGFIGGPPCPDFSVGGKNRGQHGENGKLTRTYVHLICKQKPDFFLFENVKGLWRTARHRQFYEDMKNELSELGGYKLTEQLVNAIEFGAPQDRDRIILFGVSEKLLKKQGLKIENFDWKAHKKYPRDVLAEDYWPDADKLSPERKKPSKVPAELTVQYWFDKNKVEQHPNAHHQFKPRAGLAKFKTILEGDDSKKSYKRLHRWRYSPTVAYGNNEVHIHPYLPRRISVAEALSLQSLPPNFELPCNMSLTNMFKTVGNGVPYRAALGIAMSVKDFFGGKMYDDNSEQSR